MLAIETDELTKDFGKKRVVDAVSLSVPMSCVYGFLGPNGAGKTTTMRLILGLLKADRGEIRLLGHDLRNNRKDALASVGALIETPSLYQHLNGRSNLDITRRLLGLPATEIERVLEIVDLCQAAGAPVKTYSLGMKQRLALARALLGQPRLLLLDEPTNGLDPDGIIAMRALIRTLPDQINGTVLVSSHLLAEVEQVADYAGVMRAGRLAVQEEVAKLLHQEPTFIFKLDDGEAGLELLSSRGMVVYPEGDRCIRLVCAPDDVDQQVATANRILVEGQHAVFSIVRRQRTLESVYQNSRATTSLQPEISQ